ncbi:hypothetical protein KW805_03190 [Candidatus Pacearchaeota archaeon]|nr:hypothetical protein [Candidatus Pacearchaeota archaeon]
MKKLMLALLFAFLFMPACYALTFEMKDSYQQGETMIVKVSGNILEPITDDQVVFKRGHVAIAPEYDITRIGKDYYVWAIAPAPGNYTLSLQGVTATNGGQIEKRDYEQNFTTDGMIDYAVKPGFIDTNKNFQIHVFLYEDADKEIHLNFPVSGTTVLHPGDNILSFSIKDVEGDFFTLIEVGEYSLPAHIIGRAAKRQPFIEVQPTFVDSVVFVSSLPTYPVEIVNVGEISTPLSIDYDKDYFAIIPSDVKEISGGEHRVFNVTLKKTSSQLVQRNITFAYGNQSVLLPFSFKFTSNMSEASTTLYNLTGNSSLLRCVEIAGGRICTESQECSGSLKQTVEGMCCSGICVERPAASKAWIGYLIAGIVILGLLIVYLKYKRVKVPSATDKILGKKF